MLRECRTTAIRSCEGFGVWGGMTEDERKSVVLRWSETAPLAERGRHQQVAVEGAERLC